MLAQQPVLLLQVLQCKMNAVQVAPRNRQVAWPSRTGREYDGVKSLQGFQGRIGLRLKNDALRLHDREPAVDHPFLQLEIRDAVAQQPARPLAFLKHRHRMTGAIELLRGGQAGRPRTDHRHALACTCRRRLRLDPTAFERTLDDRLFNGLDHGRSLVNAQHAGLFAQGRAQASRELRKVVRRRQPVPSQPPLAAIHQIIPFRTQVP